MAKLLFFVSTNIKRVWHNCYLSSPPILKGAWQNCYLSSPPILKEHGTIVTLPVLDAGHEGDPPDPARSVASRRAHRTGRLAHN